DVYVITITSGQAVTAGPNGPCVPRKELVSTLQVLLQSRRLKVASCLPEAQLLVAELATFQAKVTPSPLETGLAWRQGPRDVLVLGVALAAWLAENRVETYTGPLVFWPDPYGDDDSQGLPGGSAAMMWR